jgi:putative ABC transport system permease protein
MPRRCDRSPSPRLDALLLAVFASAEVALAAVGLFGVMATLVRQRRREFGVRLALGASPKDLGRMVLRRGLTLGLVRAGTGLLGSAAANRLLVALLYRVSPDDAVTLASVAVLLLVISGLATVVPARLSARVDPLIALRAE